MRCHNFSSCSLFRDIIDIARANQKPLFIHSADQSQVVLNIAIKLYNTLDVILEDSLFSRTIKLYSLDVILENLTYLLILI